MLFSHSPRTPQGWTVNRSFLGSTYNTKKGVGVCFFAHPGLTGLRIAQSHRIDNAEAHASTDYINIVYRYAPRRRLVAICLL